MKNSWIILSLGIGVFVALGSYFCIIPSWKASLFFVFPIATYTVIRNNPEFVFIRFASMLLLVFLGINKFFFSYSEKSEGYEFNIGNHEIGTPVNIILLLLVGLSLILHFLKINGKIEGGLLNYKSNKVGNIKGKNNQINQS